MVSRWAATLVLLAQAGCVGIGFPFPGAAAATVPAPSGKQSLTVVLGKDVPRPAETRAEIERSLGKSFSLAWGEIPSAPPVHDGSAAVEAELAAARQSYVNAEFAPCLVKTGERQRVAELLAQGKRTLAERLLFWRIACTVGAGRLADARRDAAAFAVYGLDAPPDVEAAAPDVEALLAEQLRLIAAAPRYRLRVTATGPRDAKAAPHAVVSLDGVEGACVAPCTLDVPAGDHAVRVEADGYAPDARMVRVEEAGGAIGFELAAAEPELAARQWTARHATSPSIDDAASVSLLATALRARSLAVIAVEPAARGARLQGALALDGGIAGRAQRTAASEAEVPSAASALLRDLLLRGQLIDPSPPLVSRPLFWVGVGLAAVAAATVTAVLLYEPEQTIKVGF